MTISGGQILHKAGYPRITFPRIRKWVPAMRKFLASFSFTGTSASSGKGDQKPLFLKERNKNTEI